MELSGGPHAQVERIRHRTSRHTKNFMLHSDPGSKRIRTLLGANHLAVGQNDGTLVNGTKDSNPGDRWFNFDPYPSLVGPEPKPKGDLSGSAANMGAAS